MLHLVMCRAGPQALKPSGQALFRPGQAGPTQEACKGLGPGSGLHQARAQGPGLGLLVLAALPYLEGCSLKIPASIICTMLEILAMPLNLRPASRVSLNNLS